MRHIFFAFPGGTAGVALILFRLSAAIAIAGAAGQHPRHDMKLLALAYGSAIGLVAGFPTRLLALAGATLAIITWTAQTCPTACSGAFILDMLGLALIGPGAYSVDALLSGRRTVHLPG